MQVIAITGAASFIGQHLIQYLLHNDHCEIRLLAHRRTIDEAFFLNGERVKIFQGDLLKPETLTGFLTKGCIVIHLAYLSAGSKQDNMNAVSNLVAQCAEVGIKRFIHCSTAVVVGNVPDDLIHESTECHPMTQYEKIKFEIEEVLLELGESFELSIIRPTAVFGAGGKNLLKLADHLTRGKLVLNYLKSCIFNDRKMNLVCIDNVVAAIFFLAKTSNAVNKEIFIISDDEFEANNYREIEKQLMLGFACSDYKLSRMPMPKKVLRVFLQMMGRSNVNPRRTYDCSKLVNIGYVKQTTFSEGLKSFIEWYKQR